MQRPHTLAGADAERRPARRRKVQATGVKPARAGFTGQCQILFSKTMIVQRGLHVLSADFHL